MKPPERADGRPKLLTLRALGLGDLLTAAPALRALARSFPRHRRLLAAPRSLAPLVGLLGVVDDVVDTTGLAPLYGSLEGADVAVNLHGGGPQSHRVLLAADSRRLISFHHPNVPASAGGPTWRADEHEVRRWCRMLEEHGIPADPGELDLPPPPVPAPEAAHGATLVHPGAASAARRWPPDRWAAVARSEASHGRRVIITGGPDEAELARTVAQDAGLPGSSVYAGRTGLLELAALVGVAGRVVCGDTGVAHLATALGTPSVVLFGPTSPAAWGPPDLPRHRALWAGATGDPHARQPDPGLLKIQVEDVTVALSDLPERSRQNGSVSGGGSRTGPLRSHTTYTITTNGGTRMTENGFSFDLSGKTALVTGAASGLGAATARVLAGRGARVVCADVDEPGAKEVAVEIGGRPVQLDVSDPSAVEAVVRDLVETEEHVDVLINNAGVDFILSATEMSLEQWDRIQQVNLRAPWLLSRALLPHMIERGSGQIVNISSTASKKGWENASAYTASKHGVMGLTQALHAESREHGVRVMAVVAGGMRTNFFRTLDPPPPPENLQPPENVANCILFMLCQPAESTIHELIVTPMTETSYP